MKIGNVEINNKVFLAPMAGVTDLPFRILCKKEGCGMTYTEMVSAKGLYYQDKKTEELLRISEIEKPCAIQIFGSDPDIMGEIALRLSGSKADIIDINMGCPTPKIVKNGDGCALMKNPKLIGQIIRKVSNNTDKPVTIKIRKGWDQNSVNAVEIAKIAEDNGAKAVTVHGRTREQFYGGKADWDIIKEVKKAVTIPVIGNGDVFTPEDAKNMLDYTGCDAVMIGRGARGNPWIFKRTIRYLETGELLSEPTYSEKIEKIFEHFNLMIEYKGEKTALKEMRKHIAWYLKGIKDSSKIKGQINKLNDFEEIKKILIQYREYLNSNLNL